MGVVCLLAGGQWFFGTLQDTIRTPKIHDILHGVLHNRIRLGWYSNHYLWSLDKPYIRHISVLF